MRMSNRGIEIERAPRLLACGERRGMPLHPKGGRGAFEVYNFRLIYRYILDAGRVKMAGPFGKLRAGRMDGDLWVLFSILGNGQIMLNRLLNCPHWGARRGVRGDRRRGRV
jgi:hypothetical protein